MEQVNGKFKHCCVSSSNTYFFKLWNSLPQDLVDIKRLYGLKEKSDKFIEEKILQGLIKYKTLTLAQDVPKPKLLGKVFLSKCQLSCSNTLPAHLLLEVL